MLKNVLNSYFQIEVNYDDYSNEVASLILPNVPNWSGGQYWELVQKKKSVVFFEFKNEYQNSIEIRKMANLIQDEFNIGVLQCLESQSAARFCEAMHLTESKIAIFKGTRGLSDYELFVGNLEHVELAHFAIESAKHKLVSLVPQRWRDGYMQNSAWLIDFFAPWCPPCKAMMPEFRQMSSELENVRLGTVDCTMHPELCTDYQIKSYPTQIFVNGTNHPVTLTSHPTLDNVNSFIFDIQNPAFVNLGADSFYEKVQNRPIGEMWLLYFTVVNCGMCEYVMPEIRLFAKRYSKLINVGIVNCSDEKELCKSQRLEARMSI